MQRWEHMSVGQTGCRSYKEVQQWIAKKVIDAGDQGFEMVSFHISKTGLFRVRWHATVIFKRPQR